MRVWALAVSLVLVLMFVFWFLSVERSVNFVGAEVLLNNFSNSSREYVLSRLGLLGCDADFGFVEDGLVCFVCEPVVCFNVSVVDRGVEGLRWNVVGLPVARGLSVGVVDMFFDGVGSRLGCVLSGDVVDCGSSFFVLDGGRVRWFLRSGFGLEDVVSRLCVDYDCVAGVRCVCGDVGYEVYGDEIYRFRLA